MPKMILICDYCKKEYSSYQRGKYNNFCSIQCRREGAFLMSKNITVEDRKRRSQQIIKVNKTINNRREIIEKSAATKRGRGGKNSYIKYFGQHLHRLILENKIGRKLEKGEIVHHIDGNKRNNNPDNLQLMTQSEHIKLHLNRGDLKR